MARTTVISVERCLFNAFIFISISTIPSTNIQSSVIKHIHIPSITILFNCISMVPIINLFFPLSSKDHPKYQQKIAYSVAHGNIISIRTNDLASRSTHILSSNTGDEMLVNMCNLHIFHSICISIQYSKSHNLSPH